MPFIRIEIKNYFGYISTIGLYTFRGRVPQIPIIYSLKNYLKHDERKIIMYVIKIHAIIHDKNISGKNSEIHQIPLTHNIPIIQNIVKINGCIF